MPPLPETSAEAQRQAGLSAPAEQVQAETSGRQGLRTRLRLWEQRPNRAVIVDLWGGGGPSSYCDLSVL